MGERNQRGAVILIACYFIQVPDVQKTGSKALAWDRVGLESRG